MEGIKSRLQIQYSNVAPGAAAAAGAAPAVYAGPIDCAKQVVQKLGVTRGLYRSVLWRDVPFTPHQTLTLPPLLC
jgi:hypothetical protein